MRLFCLNALLRDPDPTPGGGGGTPPPAPAAPPAIDYADLVKHLTPLLTEALKPKPVDPPPADPKPAGEGEDTKFKALQDTHRKTQEDLDRLKKAHEGALQRADEKERAAAISTVLSEFTFASPEAAAAARALFGANVTRAKDGETLVGPDGTTPYDKYLRDALEGPNSFFLAPKHVGGAGAGNPGSSGRKAVNLEDIKPGMSPESLADVRLQIASLMR